jgi:hypothetical protein
MSIQFHTDALSHNSTSCQACQQFFNLISQLAAPEEKVVPVASRRLASASARLFQLDWKVSSAQNVGINIFCYICYNSRTFLINKKRTD